MRHDRRVGRYYITEYSEMWNSIIDLDSTTGKLLFTKYADDVDFYDSNSIRMMYEIKNSTATTVEVAPLFPNSCETQCRVIPKTTELNPFFEDLCLLAYVLSFANHFVDFDFLIDHYDFLKTKTYANFNTDLKQQYVTINIKRLFLEFSKVLGCRYNSNEVSDPGKDIVFDFGRLPNIEERSKIITFSTGYHNRANINDIVRLFDYLISVPDACEFMYWCYENLSREYKLFVDDIFSDTGNKFPTFKINPFTYELCVCIKSYPFDEDSTRDFIANHLFKNCDDVFHFPITRCGKILTVDVYKLSELLNKRFYGHGRNIEVLKTLKNIVLTSPKSKKKTVSSIPISFRKSLKEELSWVLSVLSPSWIVSDMLEKLKFKFKENFCVEITLPQS